MSSYNQPYGYADVLSRPCGAHLNIQLLVNITEQSPFGKKGQKGGQKSVMFTGER